MTPPSTALPYTDQQAAAIETQGVSIALSAGAGCGKTFVLTQRFLKGLEPGDVSTELHSLVAITFTDKAAREMRDRIRFACNQRLQQCPNADVEYWLDVLRGLDSARVSTIHSFCTSLLRSQAIEAGLDPRFSILKPSMADTLLRQTATNTLYGLLEADDADAHAFVLTFGLERARELIRDLSRQHFQVDFTKFKCQSPETIVTEWSSRWESDFVPELVSEFRNDPRTRQTYDLLRENEPTHAVMQQRRSTLLELLDPSASWKDPLSALQSIHEHARVQGGGTLKHWPQADIFDLIKSGLTELRKAADETKKNLSVNAEDLKQATEFSGRGLRLARLTSERFRQAKDSQGLLDFDDLLLLARNLLRDNVDVRQRQAAGIRLLMVDEFQDTDPIQADIVRMLCGSELTRGRLFLVGDTKQSIYRFRRADPGVFDRLTREIPQRGRLPLSVNFRSQPAILNFVNHVFAEAMGDSYEPLTPFDSVQYSPTPVIEFLLAESDRDRAELNPSVGQGSPAVRSSEDSVVESIPTDSRGDDPLDEETDHKSSKILAGALRAREADWIAGRCAELLSDPICRIRQKDKSGQMTLRRIAASDIVILFRALSNVQEYEEALRRGGIDYYLVGGKSYFAQQEVFDLLNLCRYLNDPDDKIGLVGTLRSPLFNLSDDAIQSLWPNIVLWSQAEAQTINSATLSPLAIEAPQPSAAVNDNHFQQDHDQEQHRRFHFACQVLSELRLAKDRIPLSKLLTMAVERTGYDAALLTEHLGPRKVANLRKLIEMASEFDQGETFTLKDFVERLQTSVLEEIAEEFATTLPETGNVIRLMSIHQSKGLEFPVVIIADMDRQGPPTGKSAVLHPDLGALVKLPKMFGVSHENLGLKMFQIRESEADAAETIRLLYVACTRAADHLILSAGIDPNHRPKKPWLELVASRFNLQTGLPKTDPLLGSSSGGTAGRTLIPDIFVHKIPPRFPRSTRDAERQIPLTELHDLIVFSEPTEPPVSSRQWERDRSDLPPVSVSQLERHELEFLQTGPETCHRLAAWKLNSGHDDETTFVDLDKATDLGTFVHAVLEQTDFTNPRDWKRRFDVLAGNHKDRLGPDALTSAHFMLESLFASQIANDLASAKTQHREVEFAFRFPPSSAVSEQQRIIVGKMDLVYEDIQGGWHILDYKTTNIAPETPDEELLLPYELQLGIYAYALEQWCGTSPCEVSLILLRPSMRCATFRWSAEMRERMHRRVVRILDSFQQHTLKTP